MFQRLINIFKSVLKLVVNGLGYSDSADTVVEVLFESDDFIIVNKPEDVFINNHNKQVIRMKYNLLQPVVVLAKFPRVVGQ